MAAKVRRQYAGAAAQTSITSSIASGDTSVSIASTTGWPSTAAVPFYVVIDPDTAVEEKCSATISGSTLTLTRGVDGTVGSAHASGATIYPVFTAVDADEANELASKYTTKGDLVAQGASTFTTVAVGSNGQFLKADSGASAGVSWDAIDLGTDTTGNYVATIAGTTNQVSVSGSGSESAAVTLSTPQDIHTGATPTFAGVIVGGSSVVANGVYLPAANSVGFSTNTTERMRIDSAGAVGIGGTPAAGDTLRLSKNITGAVNGAGVYVSGAIQSDVTTAVRVFRSTPSTANSNFTLTQISHYSVVEGTYSNITAGGAVTNQYGFLCGAMTQGTNIYGFVGQVAAASNRWNLYMNGTAANYMAGRLGVGATLTSGAMVQITNTTAADKALVVKGAASQTGTLLEVQNSAGTLLAAVDSTGVLRFNSITDVSPAAGVTPDLQVNGTGNEATLSAARFSADATGGRLWLTKSRNTTIGSHTSVNAGDSLGLIQFSGSDGTAYNEAARISGHSEGSISTGVVPGRMLFWTANSSGTLTERMRIDSAGNLMLAMSTAATSSAKTLHMADATAPTANPTGGGVLYVESGALKYRGSSGTVTTIANA